MFPNLRNTPKLITKEDPFHIHKTLGLLTTTHFIYRAYIAYVTPSHQMGFIPRDPFTLLGLLCHVALSGTSLVFHIPTNRVRGAPMIWPEFRLHSILFAYRALILLLIHWAHPPSLVIARPVTVLTTLVTADFITNHYKKQGYLKNGQTTMRGMPFPEKTPSQVIAATNFFYSISQVYATMHMLFGTPDQLFATLFPIQFAAFWMTLVRKGILTTGQWHTYYALSLLSNYIYPFFLNIPNIYSIPLRTYHLFIVLFLLGRFYYGISKYFLWASIIYCGALV